METVSTRRPFTYSVRSLGCKVSRIDGAALAGRLEAAGGAAEGPDGTADVLVVHTCSVTNRADRDGRRLVRRLKRTHPRAILVVTGCLAQRDPEALARMPEVDLVIGHGGAPDLTALLSAREAGLLPSKTVWTEASALSGVLGAPGEGALVDPDRTRAFLKLQDGCERRCSFCIVPSLRGPERSAPTDRVIAEIRRLGASGIAEVVLSGVHLANWGKDLGTSLLDLVRRLEADPPACRLRLSSLEPMEAGEALVLAVARSKVFTPHLHLPLQSGSDAVLRRMRRGITSARYRALAMAACEANPRLHLATDLIAGFPGETEAQFVETAGLVRELPFASLHVFPFSPRSGTDAAERVLKEGVPPADVTRRARELREIGQGKESAFRSRAEGSVADVVTLRGRRALTDHYLELPLRDEEAAPGRRLEARLLPTGRGGALEAHPVTS